MVHSMSRCMRRPQCGSFNAEDLAIFNSTLSFSRLMLVDSDLGTKLAKVRDTIDVIMMPVRYKRLMHCRIFFR
jgi:hypothetical protein